jgi:uncharacterized tellurite resistance protein B-like protein
MPTERGLLWLLKETLNFNSKPPAMDYDNYGKALLICAKGDGVVAEAERNWLLGYFDAYGCPEDVLERLAGYDASENIKAVIERTPALSQTRRAAVYDAIRVCSSDDGLHDAELAAIKRLAGELGLSDQDVEALVQVHREESAVKTKRQQLTYPGGQPY